MRTGARGFDNGGANLGFLARGFVGVLNEFKILKFAFWLRIGRVD